MRIFGVSIMTIVLVAVAVWVGFKYGSKIPVINGM